MTEGLALVSGVTRVKGWSVQDNGNLNGIVGATCVIHQIKNAQQHQHLYSTRQIPTCPPEGQVLVVRLMV